MQPSGCPCYSSEGRSERRSLHPPLGGRPSDAITFIASEKRVADAALHRVRRLRRNFFGSISIERILVRGNRNHAARPDEPEPAHADPHALCCYGSLERAKGLEPSTPTLARSCSTTELHPHPTAKPGQAGRQGSSYTHIGPGFATCPTEKGSPMTNVAPVMAHALDRSGVAHKIWIRVAEAAIARDHVRPARLDARVVALPTDISGADVDHRAPGRLRPFLNDIG